MLYLTRVLGYIVLSIQQSTSIFPYHRVATACTKESGAVPLPAIRIAFYDKLVPQGV